MDISDASAGAPPKALGWARCVFAALALLAVGYQCWQRVFVLGVSALDFFSFFTIQSNVLAAGVLMWMASGAAKKHSARTGDLVRGAVVVYMAITGVVYGLLFSDYQSSLPVLAGFVSNVLHRIMPLVMLLDWLLDPPRTRLTLRSALVWLVYPLVFAVYSLVRGALINWYAYPFMNPQIVGGYRGVAVACLVIALGTVVFSWLVVAVGRYRRSRWARA